MICLIYLTWVRTELPTFQQDPCIYLAISIRLQKQLISYMQTDAITFFKKLNDIAFFVYLKFPIFLINSVMILLKHRYPSLYPELKLFIDDRRHYLLIHMLYDTYF